MNAVQVASFTDAWIETNLNIATNQLSKVASFTDAWIETDSRQALEMSGPRGRIFYRCVD